MIAGIDLGTSSVKIVCVDREGNRQKARYRYQENTQEEWVKGIREVFRQLDAEKITAISLSSQVGTYIIDDKVTFWNEAGGEDEVKELLTKFSVKEFVEEISMMHPALTSYPIPRIRYLLKKRENKKMPERICQPKEYLCRYLTGKMVSDAYSYRGLTDQQTGRYSEKMLEYLGIPETVLPQMQSAFEKAGNLCAEAAKDLGLIPGLPVYTGCNDFYASLLGMGIVKVGDCFDVTGTSEHVGVISEELFIDPKVISSPYINGNVAYGVTGSSGSSLDFGLRELNMNDVDYEKYRFKKGMPIFLPYVNGERAPVYNADARGVFFGISGDTTKEDMAYAVMEGVAFSTWHIMEGLPAQEVRSVITAGGAAGNKSLLQLKADLFGVPFVRAKEEDTSAYGACMIGAVGEGWYSDIQTASRNMCVYDTEVRPQKNEYLKNRFRMYKNIYTDLQKEFREFRRINQ